MNTLDESFRNDMDNAVSIERRLAAMKAFHDAGIRTTCFISPIFPGVTDVFAIIERVTVNRPEVAAHPGIDEFCDQITGQVFAEIGRRGKYLILYLESGDRIILHLRMTGCLLVTPSDAFK